jgi:putative heme-binding domain-containing protein
VGPDLANIAGDLDRENLLQAMIDPSARLAPGYGTVNVELEGGEKTVGVLENETVDSLTIRVADGSSKVISQQEISTKNYIPSSMPSMEGILTRQEIRDLVAFLISLED